MAQATELVTKFGFEGSASPLKDYNKSLGGSIKLIAGMVAGLAAATAATVAFANSSLKALQPIANLSRNTGIAVSNIQELGFAAVATGSDVQTMEGTLASLNTVIGDASLNGSDDFSRLGINVRKANGDLKNSEEILFDVGKRFKDLNLSRQQQETFASSLGIDASLLNLLNKSTDELSALRKEAQSYALLTAEQVKQAEEYNASIGKLSLGLGTLKNLFAVGLAPELKKISEGFAKFLKDNKESIIKGVEVAIKTISFLAKVIKRATPILLVMGAAFLTAKIAALGFAKAMAVVFSPVILIAGAIAGLVLIFDDLITGIKGGESFIRDFFLEFTGYDISNIIGDLGDFVDLLKQLGGSIFDSIKEQFNAFIGFITDKIDKLKQIAKDAQDFFTGEDEVQRNPNQRFIIRAPIASAGGNTINQTNNIDIKSNDPVATGNRISSGLQGNLQSAEAQLVKKAPK